MQTGPHQGVTIQVGPPPEQLHQNQQRPKKCDCMEKANACWNDAQSETKVGLKLFHLEKVSRILPYNQQHTRDMPGGIELSTKTIKLMSELAFQEGFIEQTIMLSHQVLHIDPKSWKAHYYLSKMNFLKRCKNENCPNGENCSQSKQLLIVQNFILQTMILISEQHVIDPEIVNIEKFIEEFDKAVASVITNYSAQELTMLNEKGAQIQ